MPSQVSLRERLICEYAQIERLINILIFVICSELLDVLCYVLYLFFVGFLSIVLIVHTNNLLNLNFNK